MVEEKKEQFITRCGICNTPIDINEGWTETDCVICQRCSENPNWFFEELEEQQYSAMAEEAEEKERQEYQEEKRVES